MTDDGYCHCADPLTDGDVGAGDGEDFCWRCKKPIRTDEPDDEVSQ